ncbi:MAG TPA: hypothetical protein VD994_02770 [Prosthecobacter sp.]|nr:hypothetical protein [Prosthecobacter sp.]
MGKKKIGEFEEPIVRQFEKALVDHGAGVVVTAARAINPMFFEQTSLNFTSFLGS